MQINIPGTLTVTMTSDGSRVDTWTFTPHASSAGYRGPAALAANDVPDDYDLDDVHGPFWSAIQAHLSTQGEIVVQWEE